MYALYPVILDGPDCPEALHQSASFVTFPDVRSIFAAPGEAENETGQDCDNSDDAQEKDYAIGFLCEGEVDDCAQADLKNHLIEESEAEIRHKALVL